MSERPKRFTEQQILAMLRSISEDDSGGESDNGEGDDLDWEASSSDEMSDDEETEQFNSTHLDGSLTAPTYVETHSALCSDGESGLDAAESSSTHEIARDGTKWEFVEFGIEAPGRRAAQNVVTEQSSLSRFVLRQVDSPVAAFQVIFDEHMLKHIQQCTNDEAEKVLGNKEWKLSICELKAFIALLYVRGAYGGKNFPLYNFWNREWGVAFFQQTMPRSRCREIMRFLRFDVRSTRSARLQTDKFALISDIWNRFVDNSISCYKPGDNITIDEQLFPTKSRCRFTQYMPNKPDKFGIKFWLAVDVESKYILNALPYLGKDELRPPTERLSDNVVMTLMEPFMGKGRNVTTDNFFTSFLLAKQLKQKKTSLVGTMNKVRRELPASAKCLQQRYDSKLMKAGDIATLTVYQCKPPKKCLCS